MRGGSRAIAWMVGAVGVAMLAGCAIGAGERRPEGTGQFQPPAEPLYRRTFVTPSGREWDFVLGSGYYGDR